MISILLWAGVALLACVNGEQTQLVYEQHFVDEQQPQQQQPYYDQAQQPQSYTSDQQQQASYHDQAQQQQYQPLQQQQYAQPQPHAQMPMPGGYYQPQQHQNFQQQPYPQQQQGPNVAMFAPHQQHQPMQFQQPHPHPPQQQQPFQQQQPLMQQGFINPGPPQPGFPSQPHSFPPGAIPIPVPANEFASRRGPLKNMIKGAMHRLPSPKRHRSGGGAPVRMMQMHRLPKPPKYPLYDMPDMGMATPPPPPLMHPMSAMASTMFQTYAHAEPKRGGRPPPGRPGKHHRGPPRPPLMKKRPSGPPRKRPPQPFRSGRRPPAHGNSNNPHPNYEHTMMSMSSNVDPQVSSPPLGRPLNYDEYMERPSHSFTDDPWNFDPFAANYNSGMNTFAMKYNYDPLGMNALDKTQTHLDPDQLSYPGDYHTLHNDAKDSADKNSQVGGWDKPPETYRTASTSLRPPLAKDTKQDLPPPHSSRPRRPTKPSKGKPYHSQSPNKSPLNSFNLYDQSAQSTVVIKSESLNLNPLKLLSDANPGIEFTLESAPPAESRGAGPTGGSSAGNGDSYGSASSSSSTYDSQYKDYPAWSTYPQHAHDVYDTQDAGSTGYANYQNPSAEYENGNTDASTKLHQYSLAQDYAPRDRPVSDLSDSYNPHSGGALSTDLVPPSENAAMFKRQGGEGSRRTTRQEKTPMVELDGLTLFQDILNNEKAHGARSQLYKVLTS